ncbi:MAG TPA: tail fiber domain-containing protein [Terriglobia bacterium]|nr:tail fiber domain-containing protein [Terriglobia bacterium]
MKRIQTLMYAAPLLLFCSVFSHAQQRVATAKSGNSTAGSPVEKGALSGTGTTDYVPLWLSGSKLGDSKIFQSSEGEVGIGTTAPAATLDVDGTVNAASGFNLWGAPFASGSAALNNLFVGGGGNSTMTGVANLAFGSGTLLKDTTGYYNTAMGDDALSADTTGYGNTALGVDALHSNTTGTVNTALGIEALTSNTTGSENTAEGINALAGNISGNEDTANGYGALEQNTTGSYNVADGLLAVSSNTTGIANTGIGFAALYASNITGSYNTALGYYAGPDHNSTNLTFATAIGAGAVVSESNALVLGGTGSYAVKVGIGTATPSNVFTIAQGAGQAISDGWTTYSSRRWKTNIQTLRGALGKVEQLRGVSYDLKANGKHEVGVIAEEVGAVVPEVVTWDRDGKDAQSVDYSRLTALLIEATKEQQSLIHQQQAQIKAQQAQIARLASQMKTIQVSLQTNGRTGSEVRTVRAELRTVRQ